MFARLLAFTQSPAGRGRLVRGALIGVVVFLIGRFWDPYYGFTSLLQADPETEALLPASLRDAPIFIHRDAGRYDGVHYAEIATSPALADPELRQSVDDLGYRARRILLSAVAWVWGGGQPVAAVQAYAWLNPLLWLVLAGLTWRLFPVTEPRATLAWAGVVLASGTLLSVRLALTDLAALVLLAVMVPRAERGQVTPAAAWLSVAALARETALLGAVALWPARGSAGRSWVQRAAAVALAALPLAAWLVYVRSVTGSSGPGHDNFALPLAAWAGRGRELWQMIGVEGNQGMLTCGWLDFLGLSAQMIYLARYPQKEAAWWRTGIVFALLGVGLGSAVWEGLPGAASRLLLPLTLAFNVLAARRRAAWTWLLVGNLTLLSGMWTLLEPLGQPHLLTSRTAAGYSYVLETDARWSVAEWKGKWRWAWCDGDGALTFRSWPQQARARVELQVRGVTPRELEIRHDGAMVWQGSIGDRPQWIRLPELPMQNGRLRLELSSPSPPAQEGADNTARGISFACFGARLAE